jgi:hypothetical protein
MLDRSGCLRLLLATLPSSMRSERHSPAFAHFASDLTNLSSSIWLPDGADKSLCTRLRRGIEVPFRRSWHREVGWCLTSIGSTCHDRATEPATGPRDLRRARATAQFDSNSDHDAARNRLAIGTARTSTAERPAIAASSIARRYISFPPLLTLATARPPNTAYGPVARLTIPQPCTSASRKEYTLRTRCLEPMHVTSQNRSAAPRSGPPGGHSSRASQYPSRWLVNFRFWGSLKGDGAIRVGME